MRVDRRPRGLIGRGADGLAAADEAEPRSPRGGRRGRGGRLAGMASATPSQERGRARGVGVGRRRLGQRGRGRRSGRGSGGRGRRGLLGLQRRQHVEDQRPRGGALGQRPVHEPPAVRRLGVRLHPRAGGAARPDRHHGDRLPGPLPVVPALEDHRRVRDGSPVPVASVPVIATVWPATRSAGRRRSRPGCAALRGRTSWVGPGGDLQRVQREGGAVAAEADREQPGPVAAVRGREARDARRHPGAGGDALLVSMSYLVQT